MGLKLYELAGADPALRFSPHCWKTRMALKHKGLDAEGIPWRFTEKPAIAFSNQTTVPVLIDGVQVVGDSWRIALYLEERYPDKPSLFDNNGVQLTRFINSWADTTLLPAIARIIVVDIYGCIDPIDKDYFRTSREKAFGDSLEGVVSDRASHLAALKRALNPLRQVLREQEFISGAGPTYADYVVFGMFMWARCCSPVSLLAEDDPIYHWRERMLDLFDGSARSAPCAGTMSALEHASK